MAFTHRERCSCGSEVEISTDLSKTKDPDPSQVGGQVKEWRSRHACHKPQPYAYPSTGATWGGGVQPYPPPQSPPFTVTNGPNP